MYKEVRFSQVTEQSKDILIALLTEAGFDGFEERDKTVLAYIGAGNFDPEYIDMLAQEYQFKFTVSDLAETNWNQVWESNFQPVVVERFCAIRAHFHEPITGVAHEIVITPKMSFGTGHHATTYMMVKQMESIDFSNQSVVDFGTGTGILAILAEKCGSNDVVAIDNDINSIDNAAENIGHNNCKKIQLIHGDNAATSNKYDIILANITRNVIVDNLAHFAGSLNNNGTLLLSGLLEDDEKIIEEAAEKYHLKLQSVIRRDKWSCMTFTC